MTYSILDCGLSWLKRLKKYPKISENEFVAGADSKLENVCEIFCIKYITISLLQP